MKTNSERGVKRKAMGRGLSALLGDEADPAPAAGRIRTIPVEWIQPGRSQPRQAFPEAELQALAASIRERGVLQPVVLRRINGRDEVFEVIAGERRWRAAQIAQLHEIPAIIRDADEREALEIALIENIQRSDLAPLEEAKGFQHLINEYGHSQDAVAQTVGKSRSHVANTLRLLSLPPGALEHLRAGRLTAGHARALLAAVDPDRLADDVVANGLSVRETEQRAQQAATGGSASRKKDGQRAKKDPDITALELRLGESLGLSVSITVKSAQRGMLTIQYQSLDQLDGLLTRFAKPVEPDANAQLIDFNKSLSQDDI